MSDGNIKEEYTDRDAIEKLLSNNYCSGSHNWQYWKFYAISYLANYADLTPAFVNDTVATTIVNNWQSI